MCVPCPCRAGRIRTHYIDSDTLHIRDEVEASGEAESGEDGRVRGSDDSCVEKYDGENLQIHAHERTGAQLSFELQLAHDPKNRARTFPSS